MLRAKPSTSLTMLAPFGPSSWPRAVAATRRYLYKSPRTHSFFVKYRISTTELVHVNTFTKYSMDYKKNKKKSDLFRMVMLVLWFVVCGSIIEREVIIYCFVF